MSDVTARLAALSPEQRLLLELKLRPASQDAAAPARADAVQPPAGAFSLVSEEDRARLPSDAVDAYPLSMMQEAMLYHMDLTPDYPVYHNVDSYQLAWALDPSALEQAVQAVVARHPVLRTSFDLHSFSQPLQIVRRAAHLPVRVEDLRSLPAAAREAAIEDYVESEKRHRFDLSRPPLLRFCVHLRGEGRVQFTLTEFHPILDGWSLQLTFLEILHNYAALMRGEPLAPQPPPAATYRDFVRLEREALAAAESREYWERKLAGYTVTPLPRWPAWLGWAAAPAGPSESRGDRQVRPIRSVRSQISPAVVTALQQLSRAAPVPLKSVLLAVHLKVMSLLAGSDDVVTGQVVHGRPEGIGGDEVRGLFLNTLPLRVRLATGSWLELARTVFAAEQEQLPHRRYPMPALQKAWGGARLFEAALNFTNFHVLRDSGNTGIDMQILGARELEENSFPLSVTFSLDPSSTRLQLLIMHQRSELACAQVDAIVGYYLRCLDAVAADPAGRHDQQLPLSAAERHQQLIEWNAPAAPVRRPRPVHELIAAQAERAPDAPAVIFAGASTTYRELSHQAGRLAERLRQLGVGPEARVGLYVHRSPGMIAGLLAILESGGAYVPLDPDYPGERLLGILQDAAVAVVVTEQRLASHFNGLSLPLVFVDDPSAPTVAPTAALDMDLKLDALAYVIYTSGSTGRPKGVMVTHRNLAASTAARDAFYRGAVERYLLLSSFAFDSSVAGIFWTLAQGGALVLPEPGAERDPQRIVELLLEARVSHLLALPSLYALLLEHLELQAGWTAPALRLAIVAGEACPDELPERHRSLLPGVALFNEYGPTEGTVWSSVQDLAAARAGERVPIGRTVPGARLFVLDARGRPVALGVPGELVIGGGGIARGYLARPRSTAAAFRPAPFGEEPGARLYHTGDLARWLPDGTLEFLGRVDQQVKVRGFRIELGEIEAELLRLPGVREAAVLLGRSPSGAARLVAYLTGEDPAPRPTELRRLLRQRLPGPMIPAVFVLLDELPRTPNGKLDRDALPALATVDLEQDYVPPANDLERAVAAVWQELLELERVSATESFFDLGGHSLLLPRLLRRLAAIPGATLAMADLFSHPTVQAQARFIAGGESPAAPPRDLAEREDLRRLAAESRQHAAEKRRRLRSGPRLDRQEA